MSPKSNDEISKCLELIADMLEKMPSEYIMKTYYSILLDFNHAYSS